MKLPFYKFLATINQDLWFSFPTCLSGSNSRRRRRSRSRSSPSRCRSWLARIICSTSLTPFPPLSNAFCLGASFGRGRRETGIGWERAKDDAAASLRGGLGLPLFFSIAAESVARGASLSRSLARQGPCHSRARIIASLVPSGCLASFTSCPPFSLHASECMMFICSPSIPEVPL